MARGILYAVFIIPVILSLIFGTIVMAEVLQQPNRELNMWKFENSGLSITQNDSITIQGLEKAYKVNTPVKLQVSMSDKDFDCGDLYITIYSTDSKEQVVTQSGYFGQCFATNNLVLPVDDEFSQPIDKPGNYKVVVSMTDKSQSKTKSSSAKFQVS